MLKTIYKLNLNFYKILKLIFVPIFFIVQVLIFILFFFLFFIMLINLYEDYIIFFCTIFVIFLFYLYGSNIFTVSVNNMLYTYIKKIVLMFYYEYLFEYKKEEYNNKIINILLLVKFKNTLQKAFNYINNNKIRNVWQNMYYFFLISNIKDYFNNVNVYNNSIKLNNLFYLNFNIKNQIIFNLKNE